MHRRFQPRGGLRWRSAPLTAGVAIANLLGAPPAPAYAARGGLLGGRLRDAIQRVTPAFARNAGLGEVPLNVTVAQIIMIFLSLLGLIFVGLITYAGYHWVTARGNEEKVRKAQDTIRQSVWGLIIVLAAYSISYFIIRYLLGELSVAPPPEIEPGA